MKLQILSLREITRRVTKIEQAPFLFERYELYIVIAGVLIVFLIAGFLFYEHAYKTVRAVPNVSVEVLQINQPLFDKTVKELAQKKQPLPSEPIIDPFR